MCESANDCSKETRTVAQMWVPGSWVEWMELAEDVFTKAVYIRGINNWQRRMEQLLPDTSSSAFHPWLSNCPAMFSPEQSLEEDFSEVLWKLQNVYHYLHTQCVYAWKLIWLVMTLGSKLGFLLGEWSNDRMWSGFSSLANDPNGWIATAVHLSLKLKQMHFSSQLE